MTHMTLQAVRQLIANDSYAITFQSLGQYRTALLRHFDSLTELPTAPPELPDLDRRVHELKTDPEVFAAVLAGLKTHEIRFNDRGFLVGDELLLRETAHSGAEMAARPEIPLIYTDRTTRRTISHIQTGYGLADGWCILSFARRAQPEGEAPQAEPLNGLADLIGAKVADFRAQGLIPWDYRPTDAQRHARLRVLGAAPSGTPQLSGGTVLRCQSLDDFIDSDIAAYPSRGEHVAPAAQHAESGAQAMGSPIDAVNASLCYIATPIAALAAQSQGAKASASGLTRYSMWSNSTACGMDPSPSGDWVSFDEVRDLLTAQQAAALGGLDANERAKWTTKQWYEHGGAWETPEGYISFGSVMALGAMLIQFQRAHRHTPSAPGTPEAPAEEHKGVALWQATMRACAELPEGYEVCIELENGCGMAVWYDDEGERHVIDGEGYLSDDVNEAVDAAIERAAQVDGGQGEERSNVCRPAT